MTAPVSALAPVSAPSPKPAPKPALVIRAHAADFVWRCGGAIAQHATLRYAVTVVCLSFGERGGNAKLWKLPGMTEQNVKDARRREAERATEALGVHDLVCMDLGDYPLELTRPDKHAPVDVIRKAPPRFILSHSTYDPDNTDHMYATQVALECRMIA
jgi:4-oxalomesaconate hydratase